MMEINRTRYERLLDEARKIADTSAPAAAMIPTQWYRQKLTEIEQLFKKRDEAYQSLEQALNQLHGEYKVIRKQVAFDYRLLRKLARRESRKY